MAGVREKKCFILIHDIHKGLLMQLGDYLMTPINKKLLLIYLLLNLVITSLIVFLADYLILFRTGILSHIRFILNAPSYIILFIIRGVSDTLHFTSDRIFLIVSFIFYSIVIALIQIFIYKWRKKRRERLGEKPL